VTLTLEERKLKEKSQRQAYRDANREILAAKQREYYAKNREKVIAAAQAKRAADIETAHENDRKFRTRRRDQRNAAARDRYHRNRESQLAYFAEYRQKNPEKTRAAVAKHAMANRDAIAARSKIYRAARLATDPAFKVRVLLSKRLALLLKRKGEKKSVATMLLVGCSLEQLKLHLESKFLSGMSWKNHTVHGWHVDHIKPCSSFDLTDLEQQKICFHWSNLQPLWWQDNLRKGAKLKAAS